MGAKEEERKGISEFLDVILAGLSPTASPELSPRLVTRPQASMKEGNTGDEST